MANELRHSAHTVGETNLHLQFTPIHLFVEDWKNYSIKDLARELKMYASRKMRKGHSYLFCHKLWGEKFWSAGYFYRTVGVVTAETMRRYVKESQKKHWEQRPLSSQETLLNYAS